MSAGLPPHPLAALRTALWAAAGFSVFANLALLAPTLYTIQVFDRVLSSRSVPTLAMLTLGVALALLAMSVVDAARARLLVATGRRLEESLGEARLEGLLRAESGPLSAPTDRPMRDLAALRAFLAGPAVVALFDAPWMFVYGAVIWLFHPGLAMVGLLGAVTITVLAWAVDRVQRRHQEAQSRAHQRAGRWLGEALRHADALRSLGMAGVVARRWSVLNEDALSLAQQVSQRSGTALALGKFVRQAVQVAMLAVGAWLVLQNEVSPGVMIAATILFGRAMAPLEALTGHWQTLTAAQAAWMRWRQSTADVGATEGNVGSARASGPPDQARAPSPTGRTKLPPPVGHVRLQRVALAGARPDAPILRHVEFDLSPGRQLAVVGPSGAGKSSLLRLIAGAWAPSSGTVELDGADLRQWDPDRLGRHLGLLPQEPALLAGTVAENIARFGDRSDESVLEAARQAGVVDLILRLPAGFDTPLGEAGFALSAGQARRIALARAVYGKPCLLVLDEPDAHLDAEGEQALLRLLAEQRNAGTTVVVATHKLALLAALDDVLVLRDGRMDMCGPREAVMARLAGMAVPPPGTNAPPRAAG